MSDQVQTLNGRRTNADGTVENFSATITPPRHRPETDDWVTVISCPAGIGEDRELIGETEWETQKMAEMGIVILWGTNGIDPVGAGGEGED